MRLFWQLFLGYLGIIFFALLAVTWGTWLTLRQFYYAQTEHDLTVRATLAARFLPLDDPARVDALCKAGGTPAATRLTVILPSGVVIGDSDHAVTTMTNHRDRPEVRRALRGRTGVDVRRSATLHRSMMYVAVPVTANGQVRAVVRAAIALSAYALALDRLHRHLLADILLTALVAVLTSLYLSRRVSRPLEQARAVAMRFADGHLQERLAISGSLEFADLAAAMNVMATQLDERFRTNIRQRTEQEAILASMIEGVLAVDREERVLNMNAAAATLLGLDPAQAAGRSMQETIRHSELQRFIAAVLASPEPQEAEIPLRLGGEPRWLQLHGTLLHDEEGRRIGALVVLTDVTRLHRLETVRSDFVANVSHELRTPIASIKGFVETLLDGALANPADAERFLRIISRHTDRLHAIIEDLLTLSRFEQQGSAPAIALEPCRLHAVIALAMETCAPQAEEKGIQVILDGDAALTEQADAALLEQALVNLIDNAVKYSPAESRVEIATAQTETETLIHVRDQGCGIPADALPRIFERFYRVDTGRSRKLGGTGLGLSIVKHIIQAHGGQVTVDSRVGAGSTFTIHLPRIPVPTGATV
jgi:two-component system phosphate regulon sensor histidine kinase PhoR